MEKTNYFGYKRVPEANILTSMKRLYICFFVIISLFASTTSLWAQAPQKMSYQSVLRNNTGQLLVNRAVGLRISILQGSAAGTVVFAETHTTTTNAFGVVSLQIGDGTVVTGSFATIAWGAGPYYIKTETDPNGGTSYSISGTTQMLSVPYALFSGASANAVTTLATPAGTNANGGSITGNTLTLSLANGTHPGLLSAANWTTFNNKVGTVTAASTRVTVGGTATAPTVDVNTANLGTIGLTVGSTGTDVAVTGSPANLGGSITLNIPDASATARGVVNTGTQTFAGAKTFTGNVNQTGATTFSTGTGNVTLNGNTSLAAGRTLTLNGATSGALTLAPAATTTSYSLTLPAAQGGNGQVLTNDGSGVLSWITPAITGVTTLATPAGNNANGGSITGNTLTLSLANGTHPGLLSAANWTTFNNKVGTVTAASTRVTVGGTATAPTVDVNTANLGTIGLTVGSTGTDVAVTGSPANLGGSITLNIPDASATARGVVTTAAQTFAGAKTFTGNVSQTGATTFSTGTGNVTLNGNTSLAAGRTLILNGATSGALTLAPAATTTSYSLTLPAAQGGNGQVLTNNGSGVLSWITPAITGVTTLATPAGNNANGGSISGNTLTLSLANGTHPGLLSAANWTTFNNKVGTVTAASTRVTVGGTATAPTVDVNTANLGTIGLTVGSTGTDVAVTGSPANLGGSITLNIPDASVTARGVVNAGAQTFAGAKTFSNNVTAAQFNGSGAGLTGTAASLTAGNATKLNNMTVSSPANVWSVIPYIGADGVMEVGKYIDFHNGGAADPTDYTYRLTQTGSDLNFSGTISVIGAATNHVAHNAVAGTTIDFAQSNIAYTSATATAITLSNIKDGGAYTLAFTSTAATGTVAFTATGYTFRYMGTSARTSGKMHVYSFIVAGTNVFVSMATQN